MHRDPYSYMTTMVMQLHGSEVLSDQKYGRGTIVWRYYVNSTNSVFLFYNGLLRVCC